MNYKNYIFNKNEEESFKNSSDYIMSLAYIAKYYNDYTTLDDLYNIFIKFKLKNVYNSSVLKKYVMNVKYSDLSAYEYKDISSFIDIYNNSNIDFEYLIHQLCINNNKVITLVNIAYCIDLFYYYNNHYNYVSYETVFKFIFRNNKDFSIYMEQRDLIKSIHMINKDYYEDILEDYICENDLIDILQILDIYYIKDLFKYNDDLLLLLFARNVNEYTSFFKKLSNRKKEPIFDIIKIIEDIKKNVFKSPLHIDIFYQRYGILCERKTLEQIGNKYGVTRELVRQKTAKITNKIKERYSNKIKKAIFKALTILKINRAYIEFDEIKKYINDDELSNLLRVIIEISDLDIVYDYDYQILYFKGKKKEIEDSRLIFIPYYITNEQLKDYKGLDRALIINSSYYKNYNNKGYLKRNYSKKELIYLVISDLFPKGFRINEKTVLQINNQLKKQFGMEEINLRALAGIVDRGEYCNIDRGLFVCMNYTVTLPEELIDKIFAFILNDDKEIVYYSTIYSKFEKDLSNIGINNKYYLKGLLDRILPSNYIPQKDFISIGKTFKTSSEVINDYISSINGCFSIELMRNKFPGVADYVFINHINQRNDVLQCDIASQYYRVDYSKIEDELINTLSDEIDKLFLSLKSPVITSTKIYSKMSIYHRELLKKYQFLNNHFILYSLMVKTLKSKYYFRRPYISNNNRINLCVESIISNYVDSLEYYNISIINSFCSKMHLRPLNSYLDFIIEKSNKFLTIDIENSVKKEKVFINQRSLDKIQYEINYYINSFGPLNTKYYNDYSSLPNLNYPWSKYLLTGIIRTYLNNMFTIEYTDKSYNITDFIIRGSKINE